MWNDEDRKWLYGKMQSNGVNTGTYEEFTESLNNNKEDRDWYYQKSLDLGLDVGSEEEFTSMMVQPSFPTPKLETQQAVQTKPQEEKTDSDASAKNGQLQPGWQPTPKQRMDIQSQTDGMIQRMNGMQQDFSTRMENIRKGNTPGKSKEATFNPTTGKTERTFYTTRGEKVGSALEQSRRNIEIRDGWETTTPEGREHREKRMQDDYERGVAAVMDKYDRDNAAEQAWQQAEARTKADRIQHNKEIWNQLTALGGGRENRAMLTGETAHSNMADHMTHHDLQRMADDAWNNLGEEKQQAITEDLYMTLKNRYPQATEDQLLDTARQMARQQSDQRMYEVAVQHNVPQNAVEFFFRKAIGTNSLYKLFEALARDTAGTTGDWQAREEAESRFDHGLNKVAGIAGNVVGFALDPLTVLSAGVGGVTTKGAIWLGGKFIGQAATRQFATSLGGRLMTGAIGGAANFGTFEAGGELVDQLRWGGKVEGVDPETGLYKIGDYSIGSVAERGGHGLVMGTATGVISPLIGNVSDKLVKATESTAGKAAVRAGEIGAGTIAEGTVFSIPEWIEGDRDAMDVWTDNMAMMAGFKLQHAIKSAPRVIAELSSVNNPRTMAERNQNRQGFESRLRSVLDGSRPDLALTEDEKRELERGGYTDLRELTEDYNRYESKKAEQGTANGQETKTTDQRKMIAEGELPEGVSRDIPYNRFADLMNDGNISEAARAKMYYYLTGRTLPMSTVIGSTIMENKDADGNVEGYTVQSVGGNGVITSRSFTDRKRAEFEVNRINRQAELNGIDIGERYYDWKGDNRRMWEACQTVAEETGAPASRLFELMKRKPETMNEVEQKWTKQIMNEYEGLGDRYGSSEVRSSINEDYKVDIDEAIRKEPNRRSKLEQDAVEEYGKRLYADVKQKQEDGDSGTNPKDSNAPENGTRTLPDFGNDNPDDPATADMTKDFRRGYESDGQERRDIAIELGSANPDDASYTQRQDAWNGVVERINEDAAFLVAQQHEQTKRMQHSDGAIHPATLKETDDEGHDKRVYIVDGNVQMSPDGTVVDTERSDKNVVIYDPTTGERRMIDPTADTGIMSIGNVTTTADREADIERSRQHFVQSQIDEAQGTLHLVLGQQIVLPTGEEAVVVTADGSGENITVALGDGSQVSVQRSELQRAKDEEALADYNKRHNITTKEEKEKGEEESAKQETSPAYKLNDKIVLRDENGKPVRGSVTAEDNGDGQIEVYTDTPINGRKVGLYTRNQLDGMLMEQKEEDNDDKAMPMIGEGDDAEPDFSLVTPIRAHEYIYNEAGLDEETAKTFVENNLKASEKNAAKLKSKQPKMGTSIAKYNKEKAEWQRQMDEAESTTVYWKQVKAEHDKAIDLRNKSRREQQDKLTEQAVIEEEQYRAQQERKAAEQVALGTNNVAPEIRKKWDATPKIEGARNEIVLPDGDKVSGRYVLVESGAVTASHDVNNGFAKSEGFPVDENGGSVNDRDYERDTDAQRITRIMADRYDSRAMQTPVVVSQDGVVLSGNGRTMAGELAARQNTDDAYIDHLKKYPSQWGFTPEQVSEKKHPRVVFVPDEAMPYTAETFAKFNQQEMKGQNKTEQAVKLGKIVDDSTFGRVIRSINSFDSLGEFYNNPKAATDAINELRDAGAIGQMDYAEMFDGDKVSETGKQILENMLIGKAFESNPDAVRQLTEMRSHRQSVINALAEVSNNLQLIGGYSLERELAQAIDLAYTARKNGYRDGDHVSDYARQMNLFPFEMGETVADYTNGVVLAMADILNSGKTGALKTFMAWYNHNAQESANGQLDIFSGSVKTKQDIFNDAKQILNYGKAEQKAATDAAVRQRKRHAAEQDGGGNGVEKTGTGDNGTGRNGNGEPDTEVRNGGDVGDGRQNGSEKTNTDKITPVGESDFGFVYDQFKGNAQGAIQQLMKMQDGEALGALHHAEIGDIDLVWGKAGTKKSDGYGLAKLVKSHPEVLGNLQGILDSMYVTERSENRVQLENDEYQAAVRLTWNGDEKLWLLTTFKKKETSEPTNSRTDVDSNLDGKSDDTATRQSSDVSAGKDIDNQSDLQEKNEKSPANEEEIPLSEKIADYGTLSRDVTDLADLPTDMAYRETDINELEDLLRTGYMRSLPEGKVVEGADHKVSTRRGRSFQIGKLYGQSHGGKGFAKGAPWSLIGGTLSTGTATKVIIGVPGNIIDWQVGHHNNYSVPQSFDEIKHGRPLWVPFDEDGDINDIGAEDIRAWVADTEGNYHEFIPSTQNKKFGARKQKDVAVEGKSYTIEPTTYTNKKGKKSDVIFNEADAKITDQAKQQELAKNQSPAAIRQTELETEIDKEGERYQKGGSVQTPDRREVVLRDAVIGRMKESGMDVVSDADEGQRMLDMANGGDVSLEAKHVSGRKQWINDYVNAADLVSIRGKKAIRAELEEKLSNAKRETKELYEKVLSGESDDLTLQSINEYIDHATNRNRFYRPLSQRLPEGALLSLQGYGRTNEVDALYSRICESAVAKNGRVSAEGRRRVEAKKEELLEKWAKAAGKWHESIADFTDNTTPVKSGTDSDVYLSNDGKTVIKASKGKFDNRKFPSDVDQVALFNYVFPHSAYRILGYGRMNGRFVKFLQQDFVDFSTSTPLTAEERVEFMHKIGFEPRNEEKTVFSNGKIVVSDLQKSNIVRDADGNVRVIDADVKLHTKDIGGKYEYPPVEEDIENPYGQVREQRVYHGSGADFGKFDHSFMGSGEGAKITDHVRFFRTANGEAYGYTVGGRIYIDPRIATSETPIHEYAHLWTSALRSGNNKEWQNVVELMKGTPVWDEVKKLYPELKTDDEIADEVIAQYSGRKGAERLREEARKIAEGNGDVFEKAKAISALERVKRALADFWKGVCDFLHIHFTSAEEVADRVMKDLLDGVDPRKFMKGNADKEAELKKVNDDFNQRLDELVKNPNQKDKVLRLGRSSSFLKDGGISDAEIELEFDRLVRKSSEDYKNHHPFGASDLKDLPLAIAKPIAVFNSTKANDHVVLTELQKDGKNFIVAVRAVEQHRKGGVVLEVNQITSLYPKEERGVVNWINTGRISNVDKEKALRFIEALQPHAGTTITSEELDSAAKVVQDFETAKGNVEKFSLKDDKTLVGVHNITEEKLRKALKLGGFANPSMAVIDTGKSAHNSFGEISFIAPSALVDKRTGKTAGTWTTDAYTQRYPSIERQMSDKGYEKFKEWVEGLDYPASAKMEIERQAKDALEENRDPAWELMYLKEKGIDIKGYDSKVHYLWQEIIENHPSADDILESMKSDPKLNEDVTKLATSEIISPTWRRISQEVSAQMSEELGRRFSPINPKLRAKVKEIFERDYAPSLLNKDGSPKKADVKKVVKQMVQQYEDTKTVSFQKSKVMASSYVHNNGLYADYIRWQENKLDEFGTKNRLFRGYRNDGTRKYVPETLENVSKAMRDDAEGQTNGSEYTTFGSFIAKLADRVDSTDEMRARKDKLSSNEDKQDFYEKWEEVYYDLAKFLYNDVAYGEQRLHDIATKNDPKKYAKKEYGITLTPTFMKNLDALKKAVREELKSNYFETKFERPVHLDEFVAAVVPQDLGEDIRNRLEESGLRLYDYDANKEGDRQRAFDEAIHSGDDIRFQENAEMAGIVANAKANGTYMKAPNGEPSELSPRQWAQVRTKAFKEWFGDWEKAARIGKLRRSEPVEITGNEIAPSEDLKEYKKNALEYGKSLRGAYTNEDTGEVIDLTGGNKRGGIREIMQHDYKDREHLQSIAAIPQIIEKSVFVDELPNEDKQHYPDVKSFRYYVCGLKIGGTDYTVKAVVAEQNNGNRYYDHRLTDIEKGKLLSIVPTIQKAGIDGSLPNSAYKDKRLFSILQTNSSKVVDENGEPRVVYHQTNSTVWINRETGENYEDLNWQDKDYWQNEASQEEWEDAWEEQDFYTFDHTSHGRRSVEMPAFFFAPEYDEYHEYGDRTIAAFLNIKNPAINPDIENRGVYDDAGEKAMQKLIDAGYDGFIREYEGEIEEINAFYPNQIKSAKENVGTFDASNNDIRYQFVGEKGAAAADHAEEVTTRLDNLNVAREMEEAKKDAMAIKMATGWERGADGKWRYEIPDIEYVPTGDADLNRRVELQPWGKEYVALTDRMLDGETLTAAEMKRFEELSKDAEDLATLYRGLDKKSLADYVRADGLFKAYPELRAVNVRFVNKDASVGGSYSDETNTINVNENSSLPHEEVFAHEIQHAIQYIEGFARGGNEQMFHDPNESDRLFVKFDNLVREKFDNNDTDTLYGILDGTTDEYRDFVKSLGDEYSQTLKALRAMKKHVSEKDFKRLYDRDVVEANKPSAYTQYRSLAGEVEARNVQSRLGMTNEQRRNSLASETEDVAREDQIFLFGDGGESRSEGNAEDRGTSDVRTMPTNVVTPQQRKALEARGVKFVKTDNKGLIQEGESDKGKTWASVYSKKRKSGTVQREGEDETQPTHDYTAAEQRRLEELAQRQWRKAHELADEWIDKLCIAADVQVYDSIDEIPGNEKFSQRQRRSKGWYDPQTNKIVIVMGNHRSPEDVQKTILHEAVAHYGLRKLFGKHFDTFLDNVYDAADINIKERIMSKNAVLQSKSGKSGKSADDWRRTATEEYLAELAEDTEFKDAERMSNAERWFNKIKKFFFDMLHKFGLKGFGKKYAEEDTLSDNELRYFLWRSYENMAEPGRYRNPFKMAEDIAMQNNLGVGNYTKEEVTRQKQSAAEPDYIRSVNERFNEQLGTLTEKNADNVVFSLGRPSAILQAAGVKNKSMKLYGNKVMKKMRKHGFSLNELRNLPRAIADPIAVFNNYMKDGYRSILTELKTKQGNFLVSVSVGKDADIDFNIVRSVFGKGDENIVDWINKGLATYINKEKAQSFLSHQSSLHEATAANDELVSAAKVVENFVNPTISSEKFADEGKLFRDGDDATPRALARNTYDRLVKSSSEQFMEATQDCMRSLKNLYRSIMEAEGNKGHIEDVEGFENAYLAENRMHSMSQAQIAAWSHDFMEPIVKEVNRLTKGRKDAYNELTDYMMAKHGLERNEKMAHRDAEKKANEEFGADIRKAERAVDRDPLDQSVIDALDGLRQQRYDREEYLYFENRGKDYSGLTALTGTDYVADAEYEAQRMVAD